jgi:hypothetical protein
VHGGFGVRVFRFSGNGFSEYEVFGRRVFGFSGSGFAGKGKVECSLLNVT